MKHVFDLDTFDVRHYQVIKYNEVKNPSEGAMQPKFTGICSGNRRLFCVHFRKSSEGLKEKLQTKCSLQTSKL